METNVEETKKNVTEAYEKQIKSDYYKPFVLNFLTMRVGIESGTTSGIWNDIDASDKDEKA